MKSKFRTACAGMFFAAAIFVATEGTLVAAGGGGCTGSCSATQGVCAGPANDCGGTSGCGCGIHPNCKACTV